jgi:hypothetical protein
MDLGWRFCSTAVGTSLRAQEGGFVSRRQMMLSIVIFLIASACGTGSSATTTGAAARGGGEAGVPREEFLAAANDVCASLDESFESIASEVFGGDVYAGEVLTFEEFPATYPDLAASVPILEERYPVFQERGIPTLLIDGFSEFAALAAPQLRETAESIGALVPPPGDEEIVRFFLVRFEDGINRIEEEPIQSLLGREDPLFASAVIAEAYGMAECATPWPPPVIICHGCTLANE